MTDRPWQHARGRRDVCGPNGSHALHSSWLNQIEVYFSIVQRKVLNPNEFAGLDEVEERLRLYEELSNGEPRPFHWKFDRTKWAAFHQRLEARRALSGVA